MGVCSASQRYISSMNVGLGTRCCGAYTSSTATTRSAVTYCKCFHSGLDVSVRVGYLEAVDTGTRCSGAYAASAVTAERCFKERCFDSGLGAVMHFGCLAAAYIGTKCSGACTASATLQPKVLSCAVVHSMQPVAALQQWR